MTKVGEAKLFADDYTVYALTGAGVGVTLLAYPSFDMGLKKGGIIQPRAVLTYDGGGVEDDESLMVDKTVEAKSLTGSTFTAIPSLSQQYDALYMCFDKPICGIRTNIDIAGVSDGALVATWSYVTAIEGGTKKPKTWTDLNETDETAASTGTGLDVGTGNRNCKWIVPSDAIKSILNGIEGYWYKFMVTTLGYSTAPVLESIEGVIPDPAISLTVSDSLDGDCNLFLNGRSAAGSITWETAITVKSGGGKELEGFLVYNFKVEDLASTKTGEVYVEAAIGGHDGS